MSSTKRVRFGQAATLVLAVSLLGLAHPLPAAGAAMIDQQSTENAGRYSWPALAQTVTAGGGGQLGVEMLLSRSASFTANVRVEIRTLDAAGEPTGYAKTSTGVLLGAATLPTTGISTDAANPTMVNVPFPASAMPLITTGQRFAIVLVRGSTSGLYWHASAANSNPYAGGAGWFCVSTHCWADHSTAGTHDFVFRTALYSPGVTEPPTIPAPSVNVIAPYSPTRAATLTYTVKFDEPVTGLAAADFTRTGSATGCSVGAPSGSGSTYTVNVTGCSSGTVQLTLKAGSVIAGTAPSTTSGPSAAVASPTLVRIDRTKPVASPPKTAFIKGATLSGTKLPLKVYWTAATDSGATGVAGYDVSYSTDGGDSWITFATVTTTSVKTKASPTGTLQFRVRAIDLAGNRSAWVKGPAMRPRLAQQSSGSVTYAGSWRTVTDPVYSGGSARKSSDSGAWARYTYTGRNIAIVMTTSPTRGKIKVYVNGSYVTTVDTYSATRVDRVVVWSQRYSTAATRTVRLVVSGTTGRPRIDLDAFARL